MSERLLSLLPALIFWVLLMIIFTILVKRTGLSKTPLNTAKNRIYSLKRRVDDFSENCKRLEKDENGRTKETLVSLTNFQMLTEAKKISLMMKDVKKAHDALSVYCYDNRLNSDAATTLDTVGKITELTHKLSKGIFKNAKEYDRVLNSLLTETNRAVKQIDLCTR